MSILLTLAENYDGAELLYNNRIFEVLGQCQFMKAQQDDFTSTQSTDFEELESRYQQLLIPTLRLIVALLCTYGKNNENVLKRVSVSSSIRAKSQRN